MAERWEEIHAELATESGGLVFPLAFNNACRRIAEMEKERNHLRDVLRHEGRYCDECDNAIDPAMCWCGSDSESHGWGDGHPFVPIGCDCYRDQGGSDD